jgi:hypothetical protein
VLDSKTGNPVSRMAVGEGLSTLVNDQTDRIFLVSDGGLVQCLHEIGAEAPTVHRQPEAPAADEDTPPAAPGAEAAAAPAVEGDAPAAEAPEADEASPFEMEEGAAAEEAPEEEAGEAPADEESPFGF